MFNLLPPNFKDDLIKNYSKRRMIAVLFLFIILLFIFSACLFWLFLFSVEKVKKLEEESLGYHNKFEASEYDRINEELNIFNQKIKYFDSQRNPIFLSDMFKYIFVFEKNGLKIKNINFGGLQVPKTSKTASTTEGVIPFKVAEISLSGTSESRDLLSSFAKYLEKNLLVKGVELPVSNFAKKDDLDFSLKIFAEFK